MLWNWNERLGEADKKKDRNREWECRLMLSSSAASILSERVNACTVSCDVL